MGSGTSAAHGRIWFLAEHVDRGSPTVGPRAEEGPKDSRVLEHNTSSVWPSGMRAQH